MIHAASGALSGSLRWRNSLRFALAAGFAATAYRRVERRERRELEKGRGFRDESRGRESGSWPVRH